MTAPAHVLVFRPIVDRLRERGHEVELTARDYSQTVELMHMHGLHATVFGRHGGAGRVEKALALANRTRARSTRWEWIATGSSSSSGRPRTSRSTTASRTRCFHRSWTAWVAKRACTRS